jgi:predicted nucleic acid-binding protein
METPQGRYSAGRPARPDTPVAFVDSSAIVTLVDRDDASHAAALDAYYSLMASGYRLFTTNHVLDEAFELLSAGVGTTVARQWLRDQRLAVYYVDEADLAAATAMVANRDTDAPISLTDALSMVVMERLSVSDAFAVDPSFLAELS